MTMTEPTQQSARQILTSYLNQYGLGNLADWAWGKFLNGESLDQIKLELPETTEYQTRFPAMKTLASKGRAISTDQYIQLEQSYTQLARQFGLPAGFYDQPDDFANLISGEVSPSEYQSRLQNYQALAFDVDPTTRNELQRLYGVDTGHLTAYFVDPERSLPSLQKAFGAVQAGAQGIRSGYGTLSQQEAETLTGQTQAQLTQGFGTLVANREVFNNLPGEPGSGIDRAQQLGAAFQGDAAAQQAIEAQARRRRAQFGGGGSVAQTQQGFAGAG